MNTEGYICYDEYYWIIDRNSEYCIRIAYPDGTWSAGLSCYDEIEDGVTYSWKYCGYLISAPPESSYLFWPGKSL